ncbi:vacuolar membrane-associated protein iml1 [Geranomyces variabilis]|nr:vacuolar membrane-associated protein iml1 [Geranomyces variabilis]
MLPSYLRGSQYTTPNKANPALRPSYNLWVHDDRFSPQDLVINPECFPACRTGDLLKITQPQNIPSLASCSSLAAIPTENSGSDGGEKQTTRVKQSLPQTSKLAPGASKPQAASERTRTLVLQVTSLDREINLKQPQLQISIAQHIAALFELHPRKDVLVRKVEKETIAADYVELLFRDQYVGRSDMWRMRTLLTGACVYQGKKVQSLGVRAQIKDIVVAGKRASCGYITDNTKMIFRSETAKYFIFIQMSREMWEFDEDGELYFEKCVHGFLPHLFTKWKDAGANHVVSIVLFARIYYQTDENDPEETETSSLFAEKNAPSSERSVPVLIDSAGRPYRDFYKVVVDWETRSDWGQVLVPLKREFISFQRDVLQQSSVDGSTILAGANSPASEGNMLEAINLALNPFDRHYIDRDLSRTGLSIVVITPGPGVFEADKKLLRLTAQRMVDNGIGLDLVCLSKPPLCTVPLFQYTSKDWAGQTPGWGGTPSGASTDADTAASGERRWGVPVAATAGAAGKTAERPSERTVNLGPPPILGIGGTSGNSAASAQGSERLENWDPLYYDDSATDNPEKTFYTVPHWVMCSFWARDDDNDRLGFTLRCKMYEVQMMGVMEQIGSTMVIPYLEQQEAAKDVDMPLSSHKKRDARYAGERAIPGVVRFEIGADDDEDSPAGSIISDSHVDCERYDEQVFVPAGRQRAGAGNVKTRSNSAVNMGSVEADGSPLVKSNNGRAAPRVDSHTQMTVGGGGSRGALGGGNVSVSPEAAAAGNSSGTHINRLGIFRTAAGDTVRSIESDGQSNRGGYYHPWEDYGDTLTADERVALLRVRARVEQARTGGSGTTNWNQVKSVTSATSLATMFSNAPRGPLNEGPGLAREGAPAVEKWGQRTGWPPQQQQAAFRTAGIGPMGSRKGSMLLNESGTGQAPRAIQVPGMHVQAADDSHEPGTEGSRKVNTFSDEVDDSIATSASTNLAPIKIRSSTSHLGVRSTYRDGLSTSGSFKGGHSPLANYEYLRQQYSKLSPGKSGAAGPPVGLRPPQQSTLRANLINPCNPSRNIVRATSQLLRWQHVFPQVIVPTRNDIVIHWKSLSTPACLPLTTDFFPTHEDLSAFYQEYTYTVSPADDATPYQSRGDKNAETINGRLKVEALLIELIGQRLSQGFQLIGSGLGGAVSSNDRSENASQSVVGNMSPQIGGRSGEVAKRGMSSTNLGDGLQAQSSQHSLQMLNSQSSHEMMAQFVASTPFYLSLGDHVHKLSYDASGQNVEVKRYVRKVTYSTLPVHYACGIWRKNDGFYRPKQLAFAYPPVTLYNWNYLDHLISGYQEELTENLRFWRTRFLLIPLENVSHTNPFLNPQNEDLDEEEARVVGFEKFIEVFERARWKLPWEEDEAELSSGGGPQGPSGGRKKKKGKFGKRLQIQLTTLNTSRFIRDEVLRRGLVRTDVISPSTPAQTNPQPLTRRGSATSAPNLQTTTNATNGGPAAPLTRASSFTVIAQAMQAPPPAGIGFGDRRWHFRLYESVFIGSECVDWMVRTFADIDLREEAVVFGNILLSEGLFEHATRKHKFLDGHYFYRIRGEYKIPPSAGKDKDREKGGPLWFGNRNRTSGSALDLSNGADGGSGHPAQTHPGGDSGPGTMPPSGTSSASSPATSAPSLPTRVDPFPLTRRMVIDLDPQRRSPRRETALLHYDTVHNPRHCYHFQLHWLVCSPRWIEDLVAGWTRVAEKCGFKMVEASTTQADSLSDDNPFLSMAHVVPCVPPPQEKDAPFPAALYTTEIMRRFNFVLDVESDTAFPPNSISWSYDRGSGYKRTQYVHRSGVAFVQVATANEGGGFWWVANRMHLTGAGSTSAQTTSKDHRGGGGGGGNSGNASGSGEKSTDPDTLMRAFVDFCNDEAELSAFYSKARETITNIYGAANADAGAIRSSLDKNEKNNASGVHPQNASATAATDNVPGATPSIEQVSGALEAAAVDLPAVHLIDADLPTVRVGEGGLPTGIDRLPAASFTAMGEDTVAPSEGQDARPPWGRSRSIMDPAFFKPPAKIKSTASGSKMASAMLAKREDP